MPVEVIGSSVNGAGANVRNSAPAGAGMFEAREIPDGPDKGRIGWYPAMVPRTMQQPNPENPERKIDVPILSDNGLPQMHLDPAAVATIAKETNGLKDHLTVIKSPEEKNPLKEQMTQLVEMQKQTNQTLTLLMQVLLAGKGVPGTIPIIGQTDGPAPKKRMGRPPKAKPPV